MDKEKIIELENKRIRLHTYHIIADIILIIAIGLIGFYVYNNIEHLKTLSSDVCRLCVEKTGATLIP